MTEYQKLIATMAAQIHGGWVSRPTARWIPAIEDGEITESEWAVTRAKELAKLSGIEEPKELLMTIVPKTAGSCTDFCSATTHHHYLHEEVVPKSAEVLLEELDTADWLKSKDDVMYLNADWFRSALASHLAWAAAEAKPNKASIKEFGSEGRIVNTVLENYHNALLALSEKVGK